MRRMVCFGDSNTYGYDAGSRLGRRLGEEERWPEILAARFGWETANEGMNGREIPEGWFLQRFDQLMDREPPFALLAVMLGTNDIFNSFSPDACEIGKKMEVFVEHILKHPRFRGEGKKVLLIAPAPTDIGRYGEEEALYDREVQALGPVYRQIAEKYGLRFADASGWEIPLAHDGVHFTGEGHRRFAERLAQRLAEELMEYP